MDQSEVYGLEQNLHGLVDCLSRVSVLKGIYSGFL